MKPRQLFENIEKLSAFAGLEGRVPASLNYADLMSASTAEELSNYRVFVGDENDSRFVLGGISPEGNLNVYGTEEESILLMTEFLLKETNHRKPPFFRSNQAGLSALTTFPELQNPSLLRELESLAAETRSVSAEASTLQIRLADDSPSDLEKLASWFGAYNDEMGSKYALPSSSRIAKLSHYIAENSANGLIGGVMQTVPNAKRFWMGRLYLFREFRNRGLATSFIRGVASKVDQPEIHLHVDQENTVAARFYRRLGFKNVGRLFYAAYTR